MSFDAAKAKRYARHLVLKEIGLNGQKKLSVAKVLVIGAGGLGSPAVMYLASAGVGEIGIADYDKVDLSNLQRQIIHTTDRVGMKKTASAQISAKAVNPDVNIIPIDERLDPDNIIRIISEYDFILDCTDRFETKFMINDACVIAGKPYSHAGVVRFGGQAMTYIPGRGPCLRCLLGSVPHDSETCSNAGVVGAAAGVLGSIQALEAVKYITGAGKLLCGRVLSFDGLHMNVRVHKVSGSDPHCTVCGKEPSITDLSVNRNDYYIYGCSTGGDEE